MPGRSLGARRHEIAASGWRLGEPGAARLDVDRRRAGLGCQPPLPAARRVRRRLHQARQPSSGRARSARRRALRGLEEELASRRLRRRSLLCLSRPAEARRRGHADGGLGRPGLRHDDRRPHGGPRSRRADDLRWALSLLSRPSEPARSGSHGLAAARGLPQQQRRRHGHRRRSRHRLRASPRRPAMGERRRHRLPHRGAPDDRRDRPPRHPSHDEPPPARQPAFRLPISPSTIR